MWMNGSPYVVGIAGGSASGKTSFLKHLIQALPAKSCCIVSQDNYYHPLHLQRADENGIVNFDLPTAIDREHFHADMLALLQGNSITKTEYTFNNANKAPEIIAVHPAPILIMEGLFIFHYQEINDLLNLKIFIDAREDIKLKRRLQRDKNERGYPENEVTYQWHNHVTPSYNNFLAPYRDYSDIIVTNNINYDNGLQVVVNHLKTILNS